MGVETGALLLGLAKATYNFQEIKRIAFDLVSLCSAIELSCSINFDLFDCVLLPNGQVDMPGRIDLNHE